MGGERILSILSHSAKFSPDYTNHLPSRLTRKSFLPSRIKDFNSTCSIVGIIFLDSVDIFRTSRYQNCLRRKIFDPEGGGRRYD